MQLIPSFPALILLLAAARALAVETVEVFTDSQAAIARLQQEQLKVRHYALTIYDVNQVQRWEQAFSQGLSKEEHKAREQVNQRITDMGGEAAFAHALEQQYAPLKRSITLGLMEYPSVVVDETYAVYGTDDVAMALRKVKLWRSKNQ